MGNVNKVILVGNLGQDPAVRYMENGASKATFSLATNEVYKNRDSERVTQTQWHNIVLWRGAADIADKYLRKGDPVYIEGKLTYRSYDDKEGNKRSITEVVAREIVLLSNKKDKEALLNTDSEKTDQTTEAAKDYQNQDDELPF